MIRQLELEIEQEKSAAENIVGSMVSNHLRDAIVMIPHPPGTTRPL